MTRKPVWTYVCRVSDIVPNTGVCAKVGNHAVAVFRLMSPDGEEEGVYALSNIDPKSGASVLSRGLVGDLGGDVVVASPVYKQHYLLSTGRCIEDEALNIASFQVRVADEMILVRSE